MELFKKYRPTTLDEVLGQEGTVAALQNMIARKTLPHTLLFSGPSGCGKTTLARIVRSELGCGDLDFQEVNSGSFRGIDTVRDVLHRMNLSPTSGDCRVWLFDECFPAGTQVRIVDGERSIEDLLPGDVVAGMDDPQTVKSVFKNRVRLDRVCAVSFSDGSRLVTTVDHLFLTSAGWVPAKFLTGSCVLRVRRYSVRNEHMPVLSSRVSSSVREQPEMLLKELRATSSAETIREWASRESQVCRVSHSLHSEEEPEEKVLFSTVCGEVEYKKRRNAGCPTKGRAEKDCRHSQVKHGRTRPSSLHNKVEAHVGRFEPKLQTGSNCKDEGHKRGAGNSSGMESGKGWKWEAHQAATKTMESTRGWVGTRICSWVRQKTAWISNVLQIGHRKPRSCSWNRGRRSWAQIEKECIDRSKEGGEVEQLGVVGVAIYEPGCGVSSFTGVISDTDICRGFVEFYDLEIDGHPSYLVDGVVVHNCHKWSNDAQNAALKMLEDTPSHVYFMLCTTDPQKLIPAIRTRCCDLPVQSLSYDDLTRLIRRVCKREKIALSGDITDSLIASAQGSARLALVLLDKIANVEEDKREQAIADQLAQENEAIDLCRALLEKKPWGRVVEILKGLNTDPENVRWSVLGYMTKVLMDKKPNGQAYVVIDAFARPFYDTKMAGLVASCYEVIVGDEK